MVSRSKKVICLLLALLCMTTIFTDVLTQKAEAADGGASLAIGAGASVVALLMLLEGITAATAQSIYDMGKQYYAEAAPELKSNIDYISDYIEYDGLVGGNLPPPPPKLVIPGGAAGVALGQQIANVIDGLKEYFSEEEGTVEIPPVKDASYSFYDNLSYPSFSSFKNMTDEQKYSAAPFSSDYICDWYINGIPFVYSIEYIDDYSVRLLINGLPTKYPAGYPFTFSLDPSKWTKPIFKYGFFVANGVLCPYITASTTFKQDGSLWCHHSQTENYVETNYPSFAICFHRNNVSSVSFPSLISYSRQPNGCNIWEIERQLRAKEALEEAREQAGLEPSHRPATIPFPYPWIIVEPDGDVVENPDKNDIPLLPVPANPTVPSITPNPDNPDEPAPTITPTPPPTSTPEPLIPLFPSKEEYEKWRRQLWHDLGYDEEPIINPAPTTNPTSNPTTSPGTDTDTSPAPVDPTIPVDPDLPYKPNPNGMPDIGGTWDYVSDFLSDALIWMKLWFSGFLLLPQPVQTSLWALLVITVVLGLLKVFLQ